MSPALGRRIVGLLVAAGVFLADQGFKAWVVDALKLEQVGTIHLLPVFNLHWQPNFGVSLGLLTAGSPEERWGLVAMTGAIALFVLFWMMRERVMGDILALALVLGGAIGNIRDRYELGYVIDYADLHFGEWRPFLIFNLADCAITIGVLIILARSLLSREKPDHAAAPVPES